MATEPKCANHDFNITNGDKFRWSAFCPKFVDYFDVELEPVKTIDLVKHMGAMEPIWLRIVEKNDLVLQPLDQVELWPY